MPAMHKIDFPVSVKGVAESDRGFLLRRNERQEEELLGGKLEYGDTINNRLIQEFREESGLRVEVLYHLEPWLYSIGTRDIIILPYKCRILHVPDVLYDLDLGTVSWHDREHIEELNMPRGYLDTILEQRPHPSHSDVAGLRPVVTSIVSDARAPTFPVRVVLVVETSEKFILSDPPGLLPERFLTASTHLRDCASALCREYDLTGEEQLISLRPLLANDSIIVPYYLFVESSTETTKTAVWCERSELEFEFERISI